MRMFSRTVRFAEVPEYHITRRPVAFVVCKEWEFFARLKSKVREHCDLLRVLNLPLPGPEQ